MSCVKIRGSKIFAICVAHKPGQGGVRPPFDLDLSPHADSGHLGFSCVVVMCYSPRNSVRGARGLTSVSERPMCWFVSRLVD
jgi:hypothetical protein